MIALFKPAAARQPSTQRQPRLCAPQHSIASGPGALHLGSGGYAANREATAIPGRLFKSAAIFGIALVLAACGGAAPPTESSSNASSASAAAKPAGGGSAAGASGISGSAASNPSASGSAAAKPASSTSLTVGYSQIFAGDIPAWVAQDQGLFKKNGLDVQLQYQQSATAMAALLSGQTQMALIGGSDTLNAVVGGADLAMLATLVPVYMVDMMVTPDIKTPQDLKGKKVGVSSFGSTSDVSTRLVLKKEGLDPDKDVSLIAVGSLELRTAALKSGAIQATMDQPPGVYELETLGFHQLINLAELKLPTTNNGVVVQRSWLNANKDTAQKFIDSIVEGIAVSRTDKSVAVSSLMKGMKLDDQKAAQRVVDDAVDNVFQPAPVTSAPAFQDAIQILTPQNEKVKDVDLNKIIDNSFIQSAVDRGLSK
jgi:NitT/TauT family transport system substrate-binding protein